MYKGYLRTMKLSYQSATRSVIRNQSVQSSPFLHLLLLHYHYLSLTTLLLSWSPWMDNLTRSWLSSSWHPLVVIYHHRVVLDQRFHLRSHTIGHVLSTTSLRCRRRRFHPVRSGGQHVTPRNCSSEPGLRKYCIPEVNAPCICKVTAMASQVGEARCLFCCLPI